MKLYFRHFGDEMNIQSVKITLPADPPAVNCIAAFFRKPISFFDSIITSSKDNLKNEQEVDQLMIGLDTLTRITVLLIIVFRSGLITSLLHSALLQYIRYQLVVDTEKARLMVGMEPCTL